MQDQQTSLIPVAQYVRMSTDKQDLSIDRQLMENAAYADRHNYRIVKTYADVGRSGLTFEKRPGLVKLLGDVKEGNPGYFLILVCDVSRWGRFLDTDESAYYEFTCRKRGVEIRYTAEPLIDGNNAMSDVVKAMKRIMAAEYIRELSARVSTSKSIHASHGYRQGGSPGLGLRRMMLDRDGNPRGLIEYGDIKANQSDRVILVPGPGHEVAAVQDCFESFAMEGESIRSLVRRLNKAGFTTPSGKAIDRGYVRHMLANRKYIGEHIYGRTETLLGRETVKVSPDRWVIVKDAFQPIVTRELFEKAEARLATYKSPINVTDEEMLDLLRRLLDEKDYLSQELINQCEYTPHASTYQSRFGCIRNAYEKIGYLQTAGINHAIRAADIRNGKMFFTAANQLDDDELLSRLKLLLEEEGRLTKQLIDACKYIPSAAVYTRRFGRLIHAYRKIGYEPSNRTRKGYL